MSERKFRHDFYVLQISKVVEIVHAGNGRYIEAAAYFGIGMNKLRGRMEDEQCKFVLFVGTKRLIKIRLFEQYLEQACSV